jgi:hypothetical protein
MLNAHNPPGSVGLRLVCRTHKGDDSHVHHHHLDVGALERLQQQWIMKQTSVR